MQRPIAPIAAPSVAPVAVEGNTDLPTAIMPACKSQLADFKRPRQVILVAGFPISTLEKVAANACRK
jgi:hypothetical protein